MADYGLKIMKSGKLLTSTTPDDYIFWSKYPTLKVHSSSGLQTVAMGVTSFTTKTITHNLGYIPIFRGYFQALNDFWHEIPATSFDSFDAGATPVETQAVFDNIGINSFDIVIGSGTGVVYRNNTLNLYVFIFVDPSTFSVTGA